jgi:ubiquinol-cytochrome c reductase cytochrome b subunit
LELAVVINRPARWLDRRLGIAGFARRGLDHIFPDHWSFMLGEIAMASFAVLVMTGVYLAMFFNSSSAEVTYHGPYKALDGVKMSAAYASTLNLSFSVPAGLLIRQIHHWAALVFIGAVLAHLFRVFFTAAYRSPREINWVIGVTLLVLAMAAGFVGYSLPDDLLSGTGLRIAYSIVLSIPIVGPRLAFVIFGGPVPSADMIPRMYGLHVFVLPGLIVLLLAVHLAIVWRQTHTNYPGPGRSNRRIVGSRLWPTYSMKILGLFCLVFAALAALGGLVQANPIWIYGPYDPAAALPGAQPDWYLGWAEGALRLFPAFNLRIGHYLIPEVFFPGILFPLLLFGGLYLYPFVEPWFTHDRDEHHILSLPYEQPKRTALASAGIMMLLVLLLAGSGDVLAVLTHGSVIAIRTLFQILFFAAPVLTAAVVYWLCRRVQRRRGREHARAAAAGPVPSDGGGGN